MQKLMDQNQQLLLNTQSENKHLLALTHDTRKNDIVQNGEYKESEPENKQEKPETDNSNKSNDNSDSKPWWKRIF